ncbi:dipeptidase 2-like, partial [Saccoglossus kowalevskii]|uniref:Dipeptidase n=1 Tax=Saccoglossus kowalevskii TaxID=10224 RepID=A0ABM0MSZ2_SACKO
AENRGIVMVVFSPTYLNCEPDKRDVCDIRQVADHIDHLAAVCGHDCVGIGSDFDGLVMLPVGLEDVSKYPYLVEEMVKRGWSDKNIEKLIGLNLVRVFQEIEEVRDSMKDILPYEEWLPEDDSESEANNECRTSSPFWPSYPPETETETDDIHSKMADFNC